MLGYALDILTVLLPSTDASVHIQVQEVTHKQSNCYVDVLSRTSEYASTLAHLSLQILTVPECMLQFFLFFQNAILIESCVHVLLLLLLCFDVILIDAIQ